MPLTVTTTGSTGTDLEDNEFNLIEITGTKLIIQLDDPTDDSIEQLIKVVYKKKGTAYSKKEYQCILTGQDLLDFFACHTGLYDTVKGATYDAIKDAENITGDVS